MKSTLLYGIKSLLILSTFSICYCCQSSSQKIEQEVAIPPQKALDLGTTLNMTQLEFKKGMPITLRFVLSNKSSEALTFCKLNSPANEFVWTDCFRIKDSKGKLVPYIGNHASHKGAIEEKDMMTIEANGVRLYLVDIRTLYQLDQPGKYSIRFVGDKVNLLPASLPANFIITE